MIRYPWCDVTFTFMAVPFCVFGLHQNRYRAPIPPQVAQCCAEHPGAPQGFQNFEILRGNLPTLVEVGCATGFSVRLDLPEHWVCITVHRSAIFGPRIPCSASTVWSHLVQIPANLLVAIGISCWCCNAESDSISSILRLTNAIHVAITKSIGGTPMCLSDRDCRCHYEEMDMVLTCDAGCGKSVVDPEDGRVDTYPYCSEKCACEHGRKVSDELWAQEQKEMLQDIEESKRLSRCFICRGESQTLNADAVCAICDGTADDGFSTLTVEDSQSFEVITQD